MKQRGFCVLFMIISCVLISKAQDYEWWNDLVMWDGKTPWQEYLELSPKGLGPNALPVPEFHSDSIGSQVIFHIAQHRHFHLKEKSWNLFASIEIPFNTRIAIKAWMVPLEYYDTEIVLRNERKIRQFEPKGYSTGDLYFGTFVQVLKERKQQPFVLFSANLKTASGTAIEGGRVTETPGYYFDILVAKTFSLNENYALRPYLASGLYVYQTYDGLHFQNDAFLYGAGLTFSSKKQKLRAEINGYTGYLNIGDQPIMMRVAYHISLTNNFQLFLNVQDGLRDSEYTTLMIGGEYLLSRK